MINLLNLIYFHWFIVLVYYCLFVIMSLCKSGVKRHNNYIYFFSIDLVIIIWYWVKIEENRNYGQSIWDRKKNSKYNLVLILFECLVEDINH